MTKEEKVASVLMYDPVEVFVIHKVDRWDKSVRYYFRTQARCPLCDCAQVLGVVRRVSFFRCNLCKRLFPLGVEVWVDVPC